MMKLWNEILFLTTFFSVNIDGANILAIFPVPVRSHFVMSKTILKLLAAEGHHIDLYTIFPEEEEIPRINHNKIPDIHLLDSNITVTELRAISVRGMIDLMFLEEGGGHFICEKSFETDVMKKLKQSKTHYDLLLLEIFVDDCFFGFSHIFNAPVVALTSSIDLPWGSHRIGNPDNPSYIPTYFGEFGQEMTLYEKLLNTLTLVYAKYSHKFHMRYQDKLAQKFFGEGLPPLDEIVSNTSLILVNSHFSLNDARPTVPNFVEIAGIHIKEPKQIPKDISDVIGIEKFVYFSFGSIVGSESLPLDNLQNILDALEKQNIKVLWKANKTSIPKDLIVSKHVHVRSWMPQVDILCHPNILFFITHSGLMSTQEAIYCGVPMISVPIFADQFLNAKNIENKGIGLTLNIESSTKEEIYGIIEQLISIPKYKRNAKKLSEQFKDRPLKPRDEAIYWIEYVLRHKGAPQLRSRSADMWWYQYYLVDIIVISVTTLIFILFVLYNLLMLIFTHLLNRTRNKVKHQ